MLKIIIHLFLVSSMFASSNYINYLKEEVELANKNLLKNDPITNVVNLKLVNKTIKYTVEVNFKNFLTQNPIIDKMVSKPENIKSEQFRKFYKMSSALLIKRTLRYDLCSNYETREMLKKGVSLEYTYLWDDTKKIITKTTFTDQRCKDQFDKYQTKELK